MGAERSARDEGPGKHDDAEGGARIVRLPDGMRWRVSVVARLISEEIGTGHESARLVLRLECLSARRRALRTTVAGASSLDGVPEEALCAVIRKDAPRSRGARAARPGVRTKGR